MVDNVLGGRLDVKCVCDDSMDDMGTKDHIASRAIWPPKGPIIVESALPLARATSPTDGTIVTDEVALSFVFDLDLLIKVIQQIRAHL